MSDGSLSQDEIDALLQGGGGMDFGSSEPASPQGGAGLTDAEKQEFLNLLQNMLGSLSSNLNNLLNDSVELENPGIEVISASEAAGIFPGDTVEISLDFQEGLKGKHSYLVESEFAETLASLMMGMENVELSDAALSALGEAGNTMAGTAATTFGDKIGQTIMPAPGDTRTVPAGGLEFAAEGVVKVEYLLTVDSKPPARLVELFDLTLVKQIVGAGDDLLDSLSSMDMGSMGQPRQQAGNMGGMGQPQQQMGGMGQMGGMMQGQQQMGGMGQMGGYMGMGQQAPNVQQVQYPNLNYQSSSGDQGNIGLLMDVYMEMTVELGRTKRLIKDILGMGEGTIVELDKLAGEPVDILVNHKLIAKGEVVVIDENFGVRVTEIVSPADRVGDFS